MTSDNDNDPETRIDSFEPEDWGSPYGAPILDPVIEAAFVAWVEDATPPTVRAAFNAGYLAGKPTPSVVSVN